MKTQSVLEKFGIKPTATRRAVIDALAAQRRLFAREIWQHAQKKNAQVGFASVYRALSALTDAGLLRKIPSEQGALYEYPGGDSAPQLVCSRCGKIEDIDDPALLAYNANLAKNRGLAQTDSVLLYADCKRKECDSNA